MGVGLFASEISRSNSVLLVGAFVVAAVLAAAYCADGRAGSRSEGSASHAAADGALAGRIKQLQAQLDKATRKGNAEAQADALYDLAKAYFDAGDAGRAEELMRSALDKESALKRPAASVRTRVALAAILTAERRNSDAEAVYQEALNLAQQHAMTEQAASILGNMGALALVSGKTGEAEGLFQKGYDLALANDDVVGQANALVNLSVVARSRGSAETALGYLDRALPLLKDAGDNRLLGAALMELGATKSDLGKPDEAMVSYREALKVFQDDFELVSKGKVLLAMGQIQLKLGRPDEACAGLEEARTILKEHQPRSWYIDALTALGTAYAETGKFADADKAYQEAMNLAGAAGAGAKQRAILSEIGYSYMLRGSPERALNKFLEAYSRLQSDAPADLKTKAVLLTDIATCYKVLGQAGAAVRYYQQACADFEKSNDQAARAATYSSLAVAYLDNGVYPEFERYYGLARDLFSMLKDSKGEALLAYNMAQYHLLLGQASEAVPLYEEALAKLKAAHDSKGEGQVLRGLGLAYILLGRTGKALECYKQAQTLAEASGSIEARWDCALGLGKVYKATGQYDQAIAQLRRAMELVEQERSQLSRDTFKTFNMDLRQDCFTELIDTLLLSGKVEEALAVAERGRARAFLDLLEGRRSRRPGQALTTGFAPVEIDAGQKAAASSPPLVARAAEPGSRGVEVVPRASLTVEASAISPINALPPTLEEIRKLVGRSGATFVEYYVLPEKLVSWVIHPDGKVEAPPPTVIANRQLTEKITQTYKSIVTHPRTPAELKQLSQARETHLGELYHLLFEPVLPYLPKSPEAVVTIVPHGPLFSVPFAALLSPDGRYLVEDRTLSYTPAIGVLRATQKLAEEAEKEPFRLLAFGNPITKRIAFLGALPYAEKEVRQIAELFGPERSTVEIGQKATKAAFKRLCSTCSVIHLATHGLIDEERPMESSLVLAPEGSDDGLLTVKDILELPQLKARLVALSACQTGRGKITGDGVVGLSRAFVIAGTPSVLVSQWNVDDVLTEYQMAAFYKAYLAGEGRAKALRNAQLKTIEFMERPSGGASSSSTRSPRANPRYWAAFQIIGESS
ncbi:MAG TPA: CHAT domain-containing protein [Candidatus Obscuribacterales bacterium]